MLVAENTCTMSHITSSTCFIGCVTTMSPPVPLASRPRVHPCADIGQFGAFSKMDFYVALGFVKLSITSFNMRLTGLSSRKWMFAHWTFFGILTVYILCTILLVTLHCNPVSAGFNTIATGKLSVPPRCLSEPAMIDPLSIWHVAMDFCLLAVPVLVLWKVLIPRATKIRLFLLFSVGAISCFASIMRQIAQRHLKYDFTCEPPPYLAISLSVSPT